MGKKAWEDVITSDANVIPGKKIIKTINCYISIVQDINNTL